MIKLFSGKKGIFISALLLLSIETNANVCYVNVEDHNQCGPSAANSDLAWTPDAAARSALFNTDEVQKTADGCESYGKLIKSECNPGLPVSTIFYGLDFTVVIRSFIVERNTSLYRSPGITPGVRAYLDARIKIPSGNWGDGNFLRTVKLDNGMDIIQYVEMMNRLFQKYPMNNYQSAYIDYIKGDYEALYTNAYLDQQRTKLLRNVIPVILNSFED